MNDSTIQELVPESIPPELRSKPFSEWQLDLNTVIILLMVLGRMWKAWKDGGGWSGIWRTFMFGSAASAKQDLTKQKPETGIIQNG